MTFTGLCKSPFPPCLTLPCQENVNLPLRERRFSIGDGNGTWGSTTSMQNENPSELLHLPQHLRGMYTAVPKSVSSKGRASVYISQWLLAGWGCQPLQLCNTADGKAKDRGTKTPLGRGKLIKPSKMVCIGFNITKMSHVEPKNESVYKVIFHYIFTSYEVFTQVFPFSA